MKHTPGPWGEVSDEFGNCQRGIEYPERRDHFLAVVQCGDPDELDANARLIAAAPDLLAALDELLRVTVDDMLADGYELNDAQFAARSKALAAIAKATEEA